QCQPSRIFRRPKERKTRLQLSNRALERSPALVLLRIKRRAVVPDGVLPCCAPATSSTRSSLKLRFLSSLVWTLDSGNLSLILAVNRSEEKTTRCDNGVRPLTSLLSSTRTHHASSS
ncbi:unnamed protein product, partial [Ectocarpus sp. 12 AP-2014]